MKATRSPNLKSGLFFMFVSLGNHQLIFAEEVPAVSRYGYRKVKHSPMAYMEHLRLRRGLWRGADERRKHGTGRRVSWFRHRVLSCEACWPPGSLFSHPMGPQPRNRSPRTLRTPSALRSKPP